MKAKTYSAGANAERTAIIAKVRRMDSRILTTAARMLLGDILGWLEDRAERCNKRKGGIGRK